MPQDKIRCHSFKRLGTGDGFSDRHAKHYTKDSVYRALEKISGKKLDTAELVLSEIVTDLVRKHGLNKDEVLSAAMKKKIRDRTNPVLRLRTSMQSRSVRSTNITTSLGIYSILCQTNQTSDETWHSKEFGLVWKMDSHVQDNALPLCNMWRY